MSPLTPDTGQIAALLDALTPLGGLSGHEGAVAAHMADDLRATADAVHVERVGNLIARYGPADAAHRIAVLAHMDTVGLMVKQVDARTGMLRVVPVGGVNIAALPGSAVTVWDYQPGETPHLPGIPGVVDVRSQHLTRPGDVPASADDLYVQVNPASAEHIRVTTPVTYAPRTVRQGELYGSPHLDNRAGCAVLLVLGAWLAANALPGDRAVYLIGTVQEETTCAGALAALHTIQPHAAVFVDGTLSYDTPTTRDQGAVRLGGGPVLTAFLYTSGLNGWHADPKLRAALCGTARNEGIPFQEDAIQGLMSDARTATALGIRSVLVGIPMRGKHAPVETLHLGDVSGTVQLVAAAIGAPDVFVAGD